MNKTINQIAKRKLGIETLKTRLSDSLDFHDLHVELIKEALEEAYKQGVIAGVKIVEAAKN